MISILIGAVAMFIVGALWFTVLFGKAWSRLMGRTAEDMERYRQQGGMASKMIVMFVLNLISASVVYFLLPQVLALTFTEFLKIVLIIWVGFTLPSLMNTYLWEGKPWKLVLINAGGSIVSFIVLTAVIFYMQ